MAAERGVPKTNDLTLGFSRDGFHWDRPHREAFIPSARTRGAWDRGYVHAAGGVCLVVGDLLYFYYGAWSGESPKLRGSMVGSHEASRVMYAGGGTGLATLRRDGFSSMDAGGSGGVLTTRPVTFQGRYLFVNADTVGGSLRVEVLDRRGRAMTPFSVLDCTPVTADKTAHRGRLEKRGRPFGAEGYAGQVQVPRDRWQPVRLLGEPRRRGRQQRLPGRRRPRSGRSLKTSHGPGPDPPPSYKRRPRWSQHQSWL